MCILHPLFYSCLVPNLRIEHNPPRMIYYSFFVSRLFSIFAFVLHGCQTVVVFKFFVEIKVFFHFYPYISNKSRKGVRDFDKQKHC